MQDAVLVDALGPVDETGFGDGVREVRGRLVEDVDREGGEALVVAVVSQKIALTIPEAAAYSNIGINKISQMLRQPNCPFVLYVGTKKLVKRKEFEEFISKSVVI